MLLGIKWHQCACLKICKFGNKVLNKTMLITEMADFFYLSLLDFKLTEVHVHVHTCIRSEIVRGDNTMAISCHVTLSVQNGE